MHGRPRDYKEKLKDPKAAEAYARKVTAIKQGTALVLACRQARRYDPAALTASEKLLKVVPEIYTIWNYRREALEPVFAAGGDAAKSASDHELALTQACLQENPKSYSTWHHRKWIVLKGLADLHSQLKLVDSALSLDGRNFHAWNYRQFVVKLLGVDSESELAYSSTLIAADFSNYSAWHYRTMLLPRLYNEDITTVSLDDLMALSHHQQRQEQSLQGGTAEIATEQAKQQLCTTTSSAPASRATGAFTGSASQQRPIPLHVLDQEYDMVHQAFATDSADQSPWIYYRWLLGNSLAHLQQAQQHPQQPERVEDARVVLGEVLAREISRFSDHLALDADAKWPLLMTARLKEAQVRLGLCEGLGLDVEHVRAEVSRLYGRLQEKDPMRAGYYADAAAGKAFVVVQALGTV
eukprot:GHUV01017388.1.p2 GENE.GHUV01017388.1~~GHUV01017388.1.p2  ORF type:complete len:410 (+),score=127.97 GHUV01017388.1:231-1460(+)